MNEHQDNPYGGPSEYLPDNPPPLLVAGVDSGPLVREAEMDAQGAARSRIRSAKP